MLCIIKHVYESTKTYNVTWCQKLSEPFPWSQNDIIVVNYSSVNCEHHPSPLKPDWERFKNQWNNYEIAIDLSDAAVKKCAAVFLACVGTAAHGVFRTFQFDADDDRQDVSK